MLCPACLTDNPNTASSCQFCGNVFAPQQGTSATISPLQLAVGTSLKQGAYQIKNTLGQGGFGITYAASDCKSHQTVAIKELLPEKCARQGTAIHWPSQITPQKKREQILEVQREAQFISQCVHPNIVKIYDCFEENETAYIVMQMANGSSLMTILKQQKKLPEAKVKHYFIQVGAALKEIHSRNLLHRDINPNNIMVDDSDHITLIDFGNAREFIAGQSLDMTRTITPGYAPLEQYSPRSKRGPATDFYAACATMYELLTGQLPPDATERFSTDTLKSPRLLEPSISPLIEQIILSGLKIRAEDRFQTADALIKALQGNFVSPSLQQARSLIEQGKLPNAVEAYDRCLVDEPNNADAAVELSFVLVHLNDSRTEAAAQRALNLNPKDGRGYGVLGLLHCRQANWTEASRQLKQGATLASTEAWIQANLAWALGMLGQWQQAAAAVEQALQCNDQLHFALGLKAWIAVHQKQWKTAIASSRRCLTQIRQSDPQHVFSVQPWVYPCLTIALYEGLSNKQAPDLERCLQEFTSAVPHQSFALGFRGWLAASRKDWLQALQYFEQAQQKRDVTPWISYNLGLAQEHLRPQPQSSQYYEQLNLQLKENGFVLFRLGTLLGQQGQWNAAQAHLQQAVDLQPDCAEAHHNLGWVLLNLRQHSPKGTIVREIFSAYKKAATLYTQTNQVQHADSIKQAFQGCGIEI